MSDKYPDYFAPRRKKWRRPKKPKPSKYPGIAAARKLNEAIKANSDQDFRALAD